MNNIMEKFKNTRILAIIGIVALICGSLFPYITVNVFGFKQSVSLSGYWEGKVALVVAIVNLLFIFKDMVKKYVPALFNTEIGKKVQSWNNPKLSLIPTIIIAIISIIVNSRLGTGEFKYYSISYGFGFYVLWLGIICLVAYPFLYKSNGNVNTNIDIQK